MCKFAVTHPRPLFLEGRLKVAAKGSRVGWIKRSESTFSGIGGFGAKDSALIHPTGLNRLWQEGNGQSGQTNVQSNNYWSSTTNVNNTSNAWNVNFNNGNVNNNNDKSNNNYVWCVRGGA